MYNQWYRFAAVALASIVGLIGAIVMIGWFTVPPSSVVRIYSGWEAMQFNAAVGFVLSATGLILMFHKRTYLAFAVGALLAGLATTTMMEYILNINLGLDNSLFRHPFRDIGYTGRMAPNTAIGFMLVGIAVAFSIANRPSRALMQGTLGALILTIATFAFLGYVSGVSAAYSWNGMPSMAFHTAVSFQCVGASILLWAWHVNNFPKSISAVRYLPLFIGTIGGLLGILAFYSVRDILDNYRQLAVFSITLACAVTTVSAVVADAFHSAMAEIDVKTKAAKAELAQMRFDASESQMMLNDAYVTALHESESQHGK